MYVAVRKLDKSEFAVKVIKKATLDEDDINSITNEISALKTLNHPNIVKLYDMFEDTRCFYLVMEWIRGGELFDRISTKVFYDERDAKQLCGIILSALKHCHDHNIVHRDMKPENLLLAREDSDVEVRLVDFGFAAVDSDCTLSGVLGSPTYMAPEIWAEKAYGKPVDLWAFGVITYILLCGYAPFSADSHSVLARRIRGGKFEFHSEYWGNVSEDAKDFVSAILCVDPRRRMTVDQALAHSWVSPRAHCDLSSPYCFYRADRSGERDSP